jgi:hypothetical protein
LEAPPLPHTLLGMINYVAFNLLSLIAVVFGRRFERLSGAALFISNILTPIIQDKIHWMDPGHRFLVLDITLFAGFLTLALLVGRIWMLIAAAFQLLSTIGHPATYFAHAIGPRAYITVLEVYAYGVYAAAAIGAIVSRAAPIRRPDDKPLSETGGLKAEAAFTTSP